jgi:hypothetical protein
MKTLSMVAGLLGFYSFVGAYHANAQDKPMHIRSFYYVYGGYELRYQQTGTKPTDARNTNKSVGPKGLKFSIKQQGDTLWYSPLPFSIDGACSPKSSTVNAYHAAKGRFYEVIGEFTDPGLRQQFDQDPCQFYTSATVKNPRVNGKAVEEDANRAGQQDEGSGTQNIYPPGTFIRKPARSLDLGIVTIPFRLHFATEGHAVRPSVEIGAGAYVGYNLGYTNFYKGGASRTISLLPIFYAGIATAKLNANNTNNQVQEDYEAAGITSGLGFLYGREDFSIGAIIGRDFYLTPTARQWDYATSPYVGLVLSLKLAALK